MRRIGRKVLPFLTVLPLAFGASEHVSAQATAGRQVGVAAGVTGSVQLVAAGPGARAAGRVVQSGEIIRIGDQIATGPAARLQIMLLDETVFTIGPNAALTIDEFVFDAPTGSGKLTANVARGAFRFVTGKIAANNPQDMRITLPVGTMGIRGTVVAGRVTNDRALVVLLGPGAQNDATERMGRVLVTGSESAGGTVELRRPGFATEILGRGAAPTTPFRLERSQFDQLLGELSNARARSVNSAGGQDANSAEQVAEIEPAAGGGGNLNLGDALRGIASLQQLTATLDRPRPPCAVTSTCPAAAEPVPVVVPPPPVAALPALPAALLTTANLAGFNGSVVFPQQSFALQNANGTVTPGNQFAVSATFNFDQRSVNGSLGVTLGGATENFALSNVLPGGAAAAPARFAAAGNAPTNTNQVLSAPNTSGVPLFAFNSSNDQRIIDFRYMLIRSAGTPNQLLNGLNYVVPNTSGRVDAAGVGIAQTNGVGLVLNTADSQRALGALGLSPAR